MSAALLVYGWITYMSYGMTNILNSATTLTDKTTWKQRIIKEINTESFNKQFTAE